MATKTSASERDSRRRSEELTGVFESIRWQNDDGSFIIATLQSGQSIKGNARPASFIRGCEYIFSGIWEPAAGRYGPTFKFTNYQAKDPVTKEAVTAYLNKHLAGSGAGIGYVGIGKLITQFGADKVIDAIKNQPAAVLSFLGLTAEQVKLASDCMKSIEKYETTRITLAQIFEGRGFTQATVEACIDTFGVNAADAIKRDPFTMLVRGFPGCGFLRVNALYESLNLPKSRLKRQVICLWHMLQEGNGSVWYDAEWAAGELTRLISSEVKFVRAIKIGVRAGWISTHRESGSRKLWLASREHSSCEEIVVKSLLLLLAKKLPIATDS